MMRCPYCDDGTEVREDRLETHKRRQHAGAKPLAAGAPPQKAVPRKASAGEPATKGKGDGEPPPQARETVASPADLEASARVARLLAGAKPPPGSGEEEVRDRLAYLVRVGEFFLPNAFGLVGRTVLFTGHGPYEARRLASLLPEGADARVDDEEPNREGSDLVVVGREGFGVERMRRAVIAGGAGALYPPPGTSPPRFVPQEGFLDEVVFGRDWWNEAAGLLNAAVRNHEGLASAKELVEGYARRRSEPEARFRWPSVEPGDAKGRAQAPAPARPRYPESTPLRDLGYQITGLGRSERWRILAQTAVPRLGLREVAKTIARHCRERKRQAGGVEKFRHAIREWEHDLARLKGELGSSHDRGRIVRLERVPAPRFGAAERFPLRVFRPHPGSGRRIAAP